MGEPQIQVSVQAQPGEAESWLELARRCEAAGVRALLVADHPGVGASPFVALAAAAAVTSRLRLGSYVVNAGVREAIHIASDVATLDLLSDGRAEIGLGAGHTPFEWESIGRHRPEGPERVRRLLRIAEGVQSLLAGETVEAEKLDAICDLRLEAPLPRQKPIPLLVGGTSGRLLRWGGAHAQAVGLTGFGPTGPDGRDHAVNWTTGHLERHVAQIADGAASQSRPAPALEVLVQAVHLTEDPEATAAPIAGELGLSVAALLETPFMLIGTEQGILDKIRTARTRWGITRWVIREAALDSFEPLLIRLATDD